MTVRVLGYRHGDPNRAQRLVRWVAQTRPGASLLARTLRRLDHGVLAATRGRTSLTALVAGLPVIVLVTKGARTGWPRPTTLLGIPLGDALAVAGANFGQSPMPAWVSNLIAQPQATVRYRDRSVAVHARPATDAEWQAAFESAVTVYAPSARYVERIRGRRLPVFILEPATGDARPGAED